VQKAKKVLESSENRVRVLQVEQQAVHSRKESATQKLQAAVQAEKKEKEASKTLAEEEITLGAK